MLWFVIAAPVTGVTSSDELVNLSTPEISLPTVSTSRLPHDTCPFRAVFTYRACNVELYGQSSDLHSVKGHVRLMLQMFITSVKLGSYEMLEFCTLLWRWVYIM